MVTRNPDREKINVEKLYENYMKAHDLVGKKKAVKVEKFKEFISKTVANIKKEKGTPRVKFFLSIDDGEVKLKMKAQK